MPKTIEIIKSFHCVICGCGRNYFIENPKKERCPKCMQIIRTKKIAPIHLMSDGKYRFKSTYFYGFEQAKTYIFGYLAGIYKTKKKLEKVIKNL